MPVLDCAIYQLRLDFVVLNLNFHPFIRPSMHPSARQTPSEELGDDWSRGGDIDNNCLTSGWQGLREA